MKAYPYFADIHPHSTFKYAYNDRDLWDSLDFPNPFGHLIGMANYTQSDLRRMAKGKVQLAFVGLHAIEQKMNFFNDKLENLAGEELEMISVPLTKIPKKAVDYMQTPQYDHYAQLMREIGLLRAHQDKEKKLFIGRKRIRCHYRLVRNYQEVVDIIHKNEEDTSQFTIAIVPTMEGLYNLGAGHVDFNGPNPHNVDEVTMLKRIDNIKGITNDQGVGWEYPLAWTALAHIFSNRHFGHAQPLKKTFKNIFKYAEGPGDAGGMMNTGITPLGKKLVKRLLGIAEESGAPGRRIFVDIKHLSTMGRKEYYEIIDEYNQLHPENPIPVILSHGAVNGKPLISEQNYNPEDGDDEQENSTGFNPWSINIYDEEILRIHRTNGLLGIMLDERIISGKKKIKESPHRGRKKWGEIFADQVYHIVSTVYESGEPDKDEIWNRICIGSDFDGQINPANAFDTSRKFGDLRESFQEELNGSRFDPYRRTEDISKMLNLFCHDNALEFLKKHFT